jgi:hypothetical protein
MKIAILGRGSLIWDPRGRTVFPETKDAEMGNHGDERLRQRLRMNGFGGPQNSDTLVCSLRRRCDAGRFIELDMN